MTEIPRVVRVIVADDHPVYREGLAMMLGTGSEIEVVGMASTGAEAIALAMREHPDVVVMDLRMPDLDGVAATRELTEREPGIAVLMLTMYDDDESVFHAVRAGARGYLLKGANRDEILRAVLAVAGGDAIFGPALARRIASFFSSPPPAPAGPIEGLTARETEILHLIAAGRSNTAIAETLVLSPKTVRNHVSSIFAKLQVSDRGAAIVRARRAGLGD
jgi:DNA-binding NarL/FixJ family response regulator